MESDIFIQLEADISFDKAEVHRLKSLLDDQNTNIVGIGSGLCLTQMLLAFVWFS